MNQFNRAKKFPTDSRLCEIRLKGTQSVFRAAFSYESREWFVKGQPVTNVSGWRYVHPIIRLYLDQAGNLRVCGSHQVASELTGEKSEEVEGT